MESGKKLSVWITAPLALAGLAVIVWFECRRPLRRRTEPKLRRDLRNSGVTVLGAIAMQLAEAPVTQRLTRSVEEHRLGLLKRVRMTRALETLAAVLWMDYTMYLWHILLHRVPLLWRFHLAHHTDLDMDASTALRFHFGELLASVPLRVFQIRFAGVSPLAFSLWQMLFLLSIMFHHSEVRLSINVERRLAWLIVTPRMHGIHHSIVKQETNSNWSSGLTIWDRLHRTIRLNIPQDAVTIGVPAYRHPVQVTLVRTITAPFQSQPDVWNLPGNGEPVRTGTSVPATLLLA